MFFVGSGWSLGSALVLLLSLVLATLTLWSAWSKRIWDALLVPPKPDKGSGEDHRREELGLALRVLEGRRALITANARYVTIALITILVLQAAVEIVERLAPQHRGPVSAISADQQPPRR